MTTTPTFDLEAIQGQVLGAIKQAQGYTVDAVKTVTGAVAPLTAPLSKLPFVDSLPKPEKAVDAGFSFVSDLVATQKDFTDQLLAALSPVRPAAKASTKAGA